MTTAGKTAPKLVNDFLRFDPQKTGSGNYLSSHPPPAGEAKTLAPGVGSCKHEYSVKAAQSVLPPVDSRPQTGTQYKIAVLCRRCMIHADVHISYPRATTPCPSADNPLHHFQYQKDREELSPQLIRYGWRCSIRSCLAEVTISFRRPRINDEDRELLAAPERLQQRYNEVLQAEPDRNVKLATPTTAMHTLHRYLRDALDPTVEKRRLMATNKLFMTTFGKDGRDCNALLDKMGFVFIPSQQEGEEARWALPNPPPIHDRLRADGTSHREFLEDIEAEAIAYVWRLSFASGEMNPVAARGWPAADREVERVLGAQDYPTYMSLKRPTPNDLLPYFSSLGALPNFTDTLLEFAFDRQAECDPTLSAYYLECLQAISEYRGTEQLQVKIALLQSQDLVSRRDLRAAYRFLDVKQEDTDEYIVNKFNARQSNCGSQAQEENRQALGKIGMARRSPRLLKASKQELETLDEALSWLGADRTTADGYIETLLTLKTQDNPGDAEMAKKAGSIIAKERGSSVIDDWLAGKTSSTPAMSVDEALRHLAIETDIKEIDTDLLHAIFDSARIDRPGAQTDNAIAAIQKALASPSMASRPPELWPVGLLSHGNTCYLNSLLQYYFSIKPLRDIVLDYDKYKLDTAAHSEKTARVGQRIITTVEIQGGQKFADDLKYLFQRMIKDRQPRIKPEQDLVCRAFLEPKDYALLTSEVHGDKVGQNNKQDKAGEAAKPNGVDTAMEVDEVAKEANPPADDSPQSGISSDTLVGDGEDVAMKDNESPPTPPASPTQKPVNGNGNDKPEPTEPPPLPPRRFSTTKEQALLKAEQNARQQQDVTEVHDGAMFRLRSGMIPRGVDDRGEQQDELRDIFEISLKETTVQEDGSESSKVEASSSITTDVPNESTDVYVLLDKVFDVQDIPGTKKTTFKTIETAPPLLQIAIPRIGYDSQRGAFKSEEFVQLHDELYLDRYMDVTEEVLPRRRTCWGWRKQLRAWKQERNYLSKTHVEADGPTILAECSNLLKDLGSIGDDLEEVGVDGIDVEPDLPEEVEAEAARARSRITELQRQIDELQAQFSKQFEDMKKEKYELASVFIHRGGNSSGHYWIYIRDFEKQCWRKYNDEDVTELSNEAFHTAVGSASYNNGTPTYAVYVREGVPYVRPVCRDPEPVREIHWPEDNSTTTTTGTNGQVETVTEGGDSDWNIPRQVGNVSCKPQLEIAEKAFEAFAPKWNEAIAAAGPVVQIVQLGGDRDSEGNGKGEVSPKRKASVDDDGGGGSPSKRLKEERRDVYSEWLREWLGDAIEGE